jgi:hypothetical protein
MFLEMSFCLYATPRNMQCIHDGQVQLEQQYLLRYLWWTYMFRPSNNPSSSHNLLRSETAQFAEYSRSLEESYCSMNCRTLNKKTSRAFESLVKCAK